MVPFLSSYFFHYLHIDWWQPLVELCHHLICKSSIMLSILIWKCILSAHNNYSISLQFIMKVHIQVFLILMHCCCFLHSAQILSKMVKRQLVLLSSSQVHGFEIMEQPKPHLIEFFKKWVSLEFIRQLVELIKQKLAKAIIPRTNASLAKSEYNFQCQFHLNHQE